MIRNINWQPGPVPSANCCHPSSRILIYKMYVGREHVAILGPSTSTLPMYSNYWTDGEGKFWSPAQLEDAHWDWLKSFHKD